MFVVGKARLLLGIFLLFNVLMSPVTILAESQSGSVGLSGKVIATAPNVAPEITLPIDQMHFTESEITVSGICQNDLLIKIFINEIFSGAEICVNNKFSIKVDLAQGKNQIFARGYDNLDQASPDSNLVEVFLDDSTDTLTLTSSLARQNVNPRSVLSWPISIKGGENPYAISIDWGDDRTTLKSLAVSGEFVTTHNYQDAGIYKIVVRGVDQKNGRAILQLVAVVNGKASAITDENTSKTDTVFLWQPMAAVIVFMVSTFWLGRRYERQRSKW